MTRTCIRGCARQGVHYAACSDDGCKGCAPVDARDGVLLCNRCYGRLRRRFEVIPDLVAHLRSIADPLKATRYDRVLVQGTPEGVPAPVAADLLDAVSDIMHVIGAGRLTPGAGSESAYRRAYWAVSYLLETFDQIANDGETVLEWWRLLMSVELPESPEFWTVTRALSRWPLEDRSRWARQPCPDCGLKAVKVTPPRHRHARTWFACQKCGWRRNEVDDDGLWAAAFGQYAEYRIEKEASMATVRVQKHDIDMGEAIKAGVSYVLDNAGSVERAGTFGVPSAAIIGAVPVLAEQFATIADDIAATVRAGYEHGDLIAGGARLVAAAIRAAIDSGDSSAALAALAEELAGGESKDAA